MPHPHITVEDVEDEENEEDLFTNNDLPDLQDDSDNEEEEEEDDQLEEGDRIYTVDLTQNAKDIHAGGNFSQCLAKAAHKNKNKKTSEMPCQITSMTSKISLPRNPGAPYWNEKYGTMPSNSPKTRRCQIARCT
jgi:hypothetical protein